jgi:hypothetical protein
MPKSLQERLQKLVEDINPPMVDDGFRQQLKLATDEYAGRIVDLVQRHIRQHIIEKEIEAGRLNRSDIDRATEVATKYLTTRLGKRLDVSKRSTLMKTAAESIGRLHRPPPVLSRAPVQSSAPAVALQASSPPLPHMDTEWHVVGLKRKAGGSPASISSTPPTSNRFDVLTANDDEEEEEEDVEHVSRPAVYARILHSTKKSRASPTARRTSPEHSSPTASTSSPPASSRVREYRGDKDQWKIQPAENTKSIIIGDSNLRHVSGVPDGWEVHLLSGAHFQHVTRAVKSIPQEPAGKYTVFIQAGINHRHRYDATVKKDIEDLAMALNMNQGIRRSLHVGVSVSNSLSSDQKENIRKINDEFKHCLQEENCIEPLQPDDVNISRNDIVFGIHHTAATTDKILGTLFELDF